MNLEELQHLRALQSVVEGAAKSVARMVKESSDRLRDAADRADRYLDKIETGHMDSTQWAVSAMVQTNVRVDMILNYSVEYSRYEGERAVLQAMYDALSEEAKAALHAEDEAEKLEAAERAKTAQAKREAEDKARCHAVTEGKPNGMVRGLRDRGSRCTRKGTVEMNGEMFCKQHAQRGGT